MGSFSQLGLAETLGAITAVGLLLYLIVALLRPERF